MAKSLEVKPSGSPPQVPYTQLTLPRIVVLLCNSFRIQLLPKPYPVSGLTPLRQIPNPHETHRWGYFLRTKPSNEDYFFERRKILNCSNAFGVAVLLQAL